MFFEGPRGGYGGPDNRFGPQQQMYEQARPSSPGFGGRHVIHMRGLPYKATEYDIDEFFRPCRPINVRLLFDETGRASGEADVEFASHDEAAKGMNKDKANMREYSGFYP